MKSILFLCIILLEYWHVSMLKILCSKLRYCDRSIIPVCNPVLKKHIHTNHIPGRWYVKKNLCTIKISSKYSHISMLECLQWYVVGLCRSIANYRPWCHAWNQEDAWFGVDSESGNAIRPYFPFQKLCLYLNYCDQIRHLEGCDITQSHDY